MSIITPSYNCNKTILTTYDSICRQTIPDWEWIITDDGSTDGTYEKLVELSIKDQRIKILRNDKNMGAAVSRNKSISNSVGTYIAFIDSDDLWKPEKLETQIDFMKNNDVSFSFTGYEIISDDGVPLKKYVDVNQLHSISYEDMLRKKATMGCSTVMLRKSAFDDLSMPLIRTGQDYGLWLKLLKSGVEAYPISEVLTEYRISPGSISRNKVRKAMRQWEIYRSIEKLSLMKSSECFFYYAWRAIFRK